MNTAAPPRPAATSRPRSWWAAVALSAAGAVGIVVGAAGANGEASLDAQVPWLNLSVLAVIVAGSAQASLLVSSRRAVSLRLAGCIEDIADRRANLPLPSPTSSAGGLLTWDAHQWGHYSWCPVARRHDARPIGPAEHRVPCPVCVPHLER